MRALHGLLALAARQHGHRRHRRASRKTLELQGVGYRAQRRAARPGPRGRATRIRSQVEAAGGHRASRSRARRGCTSPASTRSWSARWRRTSARCASRSRTRARASATGRARAPEGRQGRQGGQVDEVIKTRRRGAHRAQATRAASARRWPGRPSGRGWPCSAACTHIYAQVIDDERARTLAAAASMPTRRASQGGKATRPNARAPSARRSPRGRRTRASRRSSSTAAATSTTGA